MSQIDQAFIRAYAAPEPEPTSLPEKQVPALHTLMHPATQTTQHVFSASMAAEPIPATHFIETNIVDPHQGTLVSETHAIGMNPAETQSLESLPEIAAPTISRTTDTIATMPTLPSGGTSRRPLSTFSAPEPPPTATFDPVFEVDAFRWSSVVDELLRDHSQVLAPVVDQLLSAREAGRTMVGIAGTRPGVGCSTLLLCLSRLLSQKNMQVALVDGNFAKGDLATQLGLEFDTGWEDALNGSVPLAETVVRSLQDHLAILPLAGPCSTAEALLAGIQTSVTAGVLRYHYDMVLFDLGAATILPQSNTAQQIIQHGRLDIGFIVADSATDASMSSEPINSLLEIFGPACHGLIGNHVG